MRKNVVYICNNEYVRYLYVSAMSLIQNNTDINLYVIASNKITKQSKSIIKSIGLNRNDISVSIIEIDEGVEALEMADHLTVEALFKFYISKYVKEEKCIYLDVDTIVNGSLEELFNIELDNNYIAGRTNGYPYSASVTAALDIPDFRFFINTGVMVMNLKLMRDSNLADEFISEHKRHPVPDGDQWIFNRVCYNRIKFFPLKYNYTYGLEKKIDVFEELEIKEALEAPTIVHYVDNKPWQWINKNLGYIWWNVARQTPFYEDFCTELVERAFNPVLYNNYAPEVLYQFLEELTKYPLIVYGAGRNGRRFWKILTYKNVTPVCYAVTSENDAGGRIADCQICCIDEVESYKSTALVIVAVGAELQPEICALLKERGFRFQIAYEAYLGAFEAIIENKRTID